MNPVNFGSDMTQYMGPLTMGGMMADQQDAAMKESRLGQAKTLEEIANAQQNRDIARQKLPGELAQQGATLEQTQLGNQEKRSKLKYDDYSKYSDDVFEWRMANPEASPIEVGAYVAEAAKRHGQDTEDKRVMGVGSMAAKGPQAMQQFRERLTQADPKYIAERKKQEEEMAKARMEAASRERVGAGNNAATIEAARIAASSREAAAALKQQAQAKLASIDQRLVQLTAVINNPQADPAEKQRAAQEASTLVQAKQAIQTAVVTEKFDQMNQLLNPGAPATNTAADPYAAQAKAQVDPNKQYTPAEAKSLPKGTKFKGTDGKTYEVQ